MQLLVDVDGRRVADIERRLEQQLNGVIQRYIAFDGVEPHLLRCFEHLLHKARRATVDGVALRFLASRQPIGQHRLGRTLLVAIEGVSKRAE